MYAVIELKFMIEYTEDIASHPCLPKQPWVHVYKEREAWVEATLEQVHVVVHTQSYLLTELRDS